MNPYRLRTMIRNPEEFFGRTSELRDIYELLNTDANGQAQCCSIVGPRRIGKSSLLYHLTHKQLYSQHINRADSYVIAYLDLEELADKGSQYFFRLAVELLQHPRMKPAASNPEQDRDYRELFDHTVKQATDLDLQLILCCDEFEMFSKGDKFDDSFFTYLRAMCSRYNFAMVTASRTALYDLCHRYGVQSSQFWNIFATKRLGLMTDKEARALVYEPSMREGHNITHKDFDFVTELAGRHPFFIQIACYLLFQQKLVTHLPEYYLLRRQFMDNALPHFEYSWKHLQHHERKACMMVASDQGVQIDDLTFCILEHKSLVVGTPENPSCFSLAWKEFVRSKSIPDSPEEDSKVRTPEIDGGLIFLSYAHEDSGLVDEFQKQFAPLSPTIQGRLWYDRGEIEEGDFEQRIRTAIDSTRVAVLFVSPDYLKSEFITEIELPELLRLESQKRIKVFWVLLNYAAFEATGLKKLVCYNRTEKPMKTLQPANRDRIWNNLSQAVAKCMK